MHVTRTTTGNIPIVGENSPVLKQGSKGATVKALQTALKAQGIDPGPLDGDFGPKTTAAVKKFQRAAGISADGIVGPQTWGKLLESSAPAAKAAPPPPANSAGPVLRQGANGQSVKELQTLLKARGFSAGAIDGDFGPKTAAMVKRFQRSVGISADGVVGPQTWGKLRTAPAATTQPSTSTGAASPVLRQGANGQSVKDLQSLLKAKGFSPGTIDGDFGARTATAVRQFQRAAGLGVDGVVGPATWARLRNSAPVTNTTPTPSTGPSTPIASGTGASLDVFPIVGNDGTTANARYNIGYDRGWNDFNPDSAYQNSDFSLQQTNASHPTGHLGVDIFGPKGQAVVAPVSGTVVNAGYTEVGGYRVTIKRGNHYFYLCHLDGISSGIRPGMQISAGTKIGTLGNTGSARGTAPHVHFSIYKNGNYRDTVNPFQYLRAAHDQARANPNDLF